MIIKWLKSDFEAIHKYLYIPVPSSTLSWYFNDFFEYLLKMYFGVLKIIHKKKFKNTLYLLLHACIFLSVSTLGV